MAVVPLSAMEPAMESAAMELPSLATERLAMEQPKWMAIMQQRMERLMEKWWPTATVYTKLMVRQKRKKKINAGQWF